MIVPVPIVVLEPFQDAPVWLLFPCSSRLPVQHQTCNIPRGTDRTRDARFHQALGHSILPVLNEEVSQPEEGGIVNVPSFLDGFVYPPKRREPINQVSRAPGLARDAQV